MSLLPPSSGAATVFSVPPLTFSTLDGKRYERRADSEARIVASLRIEPSRRLEEWKRLPAEALVFLIRYISSRDPDLTGNLIFELSGRIHETARQWSKGFGKIETEEILCAVDQEIIELVLAEEPSRKSEFLEIAFTQAVKRRTLNQVEKAMGRPSSERRTTEIAEKEEPTDERNGPLEQLLAKEGLALLRKARNAIKDQRHYEVLVLRYGYGWPIESKDPSQPTLAKQFGVSPRQIQHWITSGLEKIRNTLGLEL